MGLRMPEKQQMLESYVADQFYYKESDHAKFCRDGYIHIQDFLRPDSLNFLRERFDEIQNLKPDTVHPEWVLGLHQFLPGKSNWMWRLATEPKLLDMLQRHLGPDLVLYSTQLAYKPPGGGRVVPWHQDGERCRTVWIPLDDVTPENGGLVVRPGWHTRGRMRLKHVANEQEYKDAVFNMKYSVFAVDPTPDTPEELDRGSVGYHLPAGSIEIHDPYLPHCSFPNRTDKPRRVIILRYQPVTEPLANNPITDPLTGQEEIKINYLVRGSLANIKADTRSRARCALERTTTLRYNMRTGPRSTRNVLPPGARVPTAVPP